MRQVVRARVGAALVFVLLCVATPWVAGQAVTTGVIEGRAVDDSGAVLPGVTLTLRNVDRNTSAVQVSGASGDFRFLAIQVGGYEMKAELAGFGGSVRISVCEAFFRSSFQNDDDACGRCGKPRSLRFSKSLVGAFLASTGTAGSMRSSA